jgi:hypothetical protein
MFAFPARIMLPAIDYVQSHGDGIHVIDTGFHRPRFDASYLVVEDGRGAFVDTGYGPDPMCDVNLPSPQ